MKRCVGCFLALVLVFSVQDAMAIGLGPYFGYEYGDLTIDVDGRDQDVTADHFVVGFLLDTCTKRDSLFNYRLNLGADIVSARLDGGDDQSGYGLDMKHTFGFGVLRTSTIRLWIGPAIKFYVVSFSEDDNDMLSLGVGGGPELGVNIHLTRVFSLGISGGYHYNYAVAHYSNGDDDTYDGSESMFFIQVAPIFNLSGDKDF